MMAKYYLRHPSPDDLEESFITCHTKIGVTIQQWLMSKFTEQDVLCKNNENFYERRGFMDLMITGKLKITWGRLRKHIWIRRSNITRIKERQQTWHEIHGHAKLRIKIALCPEERHPTCDV